MKEKIFLNCTSHEINLKDVEPASLNESVFDSTLPVFETLNGAWIDETFEEDGIKLLKRTFELNYTELETLLFKIKEKYDGNTKIYLICSLPVVLNYSNRIKILAKEPFGLDVQVVGVIPATKRGVYPVVACEKYWSIVD